MADLVDFFLSRPVPHVLVGAHFLLYAFVAWGTVLFCVSTRRITRAGVLLFAVFAGCVALECVQLGVDGYFRRGGTLGLSRYVGVFAPLLWVWAAMALSRVWRIGGGPVLRWGCRAATVAVLGWVFISQLLCGIESLYHEGPRPDVECAVAKVAPIIRADYAGPSRQTKPNRALGDYFSTRRPVVFSDFAAAAWAVRGQSEGAVQGSGLCPYPDDYLFIRAGSGYGRIETVDARKYDYVTSVSGLGTEWRLFRRKTVPHKLRAFHGASR